MGIEDLKTQIRKGLLTLVVLQVISVKKSYAAEIIADLADTDYALQEGTLYPLLSRLKSQGLLSYEWAESESGPPRKYYQLSDKGESYRAELMSSIKQIVKDITKIGVTK
jgi:PadR family transcriptional regulator, regulatory protein PadR